MFDILHVRVKSPGDNIVSMIPKFLYLIPVLFSCSPTQDAVDCEKISMMKFKGVPMSSREFEKHCQEVKINYTAETCQAALTLLMKHGSLTKVKDEFGAPVEECFTGNDLRSFNKD